MNLLRLTGSWSLILLMGACEGDDRIIWHPTPENVQTVTDPQFVLREDTANAGPWAEVLSRAQLTIGAAEGEPLDMLGQVRDMAIGRNHMYYADFIYGHVREYDFQGNLTSVIGKRGLGPGELEMADKVALASDEAILAVVGSPRDVSVFSKEAEAWIHKKTFKAPPNVMEGDLCTMHGFVYTVGYSEGADGVIHKYTLEGEKVLSFGTTYIDESAFIRSSLSPRGDLTCNAKHNVVAYRHALSPVITGYSDTGTMQWQVELADVDIGPVRQRFEDGMAVIGFTSEPSRTGRPDFISRPDSDSLYVQYYAKSGGERYDTWHLFRIDAATGLGDYAGWYPVGLQSSLRGLDDQRLYTATYDSLPRISVHDRHVASL